MNETQDVPPRKPPLASYILVAGLCGLLGFVAVYASGQRGDNGATSAVAPSAGVAASSGNPLATGEMVTFVFKKTREVVPDFTFTDESGAPKSIADWKGRVVLLNLWATWCAPCRKEMPALEQLQSELGGADFEVIAMSVDRQGALASRKFLDDIKIANLKLYTESTSKSVGLLHAAGLPTTILIDREGREVGRLAGPAEWNSADAKRLIGSVLEGK